MMQLYVLFSHICLMRLRTKIKFRRFPQMIFNNWLSNSWRFHVQSTLFKHHERTRSFGLNKDFTFENVSITPIRHFNGRLAHLRKYCTRLSDTSAYFRKKVFNKKNAFHVTLYCEFIYIYTNIRTHHCTHIVGFTSTFV